MKTAYLGIKFYEDCRNRKLIEDIIKSLEKVGIKALTIVKDYEKWGEIKLEADQALKLAFQYIKNSDFFIAEYTEPAIGVLLEAEYSQKNSKPIITLVKAGTKIPDGLINASYQVIEYKNPRDIENTIKI